MFYWTTIFKAEFLRPLTLIFLLELKTLPDTDAFGDYKFLLFCYYTVLFLVLANRVFLLYSGSTSNGLS